MIYTFCSEQGMTEITGNKRKDVTMNTTAVLFWYHFILIILIIFIYIFIVIMSVKV